MLRVHDFDLIRLDRDGWNRIDAPTPPSGHLIRLDLLEGIKGVSSKGHFYVVGGGHVWRWGGSDIWLLQPDPPGVGSNRVVGFADEGDRQVYVVRDHDWPPHFVDYCRRGDGWLLPPQPVVGFEQILAVDSGIYVRGSAGELMRIEPAAVVPIKTPGLCKAIARSTDGKLIASFQTAGIFRLDREWEKLYDHPVSDPDVKCDETLCEAEGKIAIAVASEKPGPEKKDGYCGATELWVSEGNTLTQVKLKR